MNTNVLLFIILKVFPKSVFGQIFDPATVDMFDLSTPVYWEDLRNYYEDNATETQWQSCINCGYPQLGTTIHYQNKFAGSPLQPADIPIHNLLTKLIVIDATTLAKNQPNFVLTLDLVRSHLPVEKEHFQPTIILFKFGWTVDNNTTFVLEDKCVCQIPGISLDLAVYIALQLDYVVGVATDAPSFESAETRNSKNRKTVSFLLGKSGVYMIENVDASRKLPERGCLAIVTPVKLVNVSFVPARMTVFCPHATKEKVEIIMTADNHKQYPQ